MQHVGSKFELVFSGDALEWSSPVANIRLEPWPYVTARQKLRASGWESCHVSLPRCLLRLRPPNFSSNSELARCQQAGWEYTRRIPEEVRAIVLRYRENRWQVLKGLCYIPYGLRLAEANPALFWCLMERLPSDVSQGTFLTECAQIIKNPQANVAEFAGFPNSPKVARILRKVPAWDATPHTMSYLRTLLKEPAHLDLLSHLPLVTDAAIRLLWHAKSFLNAGLLRKLIIKMPPQAQRATVPIFADLFSLHHQLGISIPVETRFRGLRAVEEHYASLQRLYARKEAYATVAFPPSPVPGTKTIVPIEDEHGLMVESKVMQHCAEDYSGLARDGRCYLYRVVAPQRATLRLERTAGGRWFVSELKLKANREPSPETWRAVQHWLYLQAPIEGKGEGEESERTNTNHDKHS
ncbi:MAG: hypothetical protein FJ147_26795 [Deltaproteobacteria bacterium]|nr:hypothetical protein [Betaproteobacteria bacterium]MBM4259495.1 hypothetical protein [Deltaproteobacteria bacterium]